MIERYAIPPPERKHQISAWQSPGDTCEHVFELRRKVCSNGAVQFCEQCILCGLGRPPVPHSSLTSQQRRDAQPYDTELQELVRLAAWQDRESAKSEPSPQWQAWYAGYLGSPTWQHRREAVLTRAHFVCECCGKATATEVHHLTYIRVGAEPLWDLVALCSSCHEAQHWQVDQ